jgi:hypothetical protein
MFGSAPFASLPYSSWDVTVLMVAYKIYYEPAFLLKMVRV